MKLLSIYVAKDAMARLAGLKLPPATAYKLLRYVQKFEVEYGVIEKQRVNLLHQVTGTKDGEAVSLEAGTLPYSEFFQKFNEFLDGGAELAPLDMKMDAVIAALESETGNVLSVSDMAAIEPFFAT